MDAGLLGFVGTTVLGKAITEACSACKAVYDEHCSGVDGGRVKRMLDELDVQAQLETAGSLVCTLSRSYDLEAQETGAMLCQQVREALDRLQQDLKAITEESQAHSKRWFSSWTYPDYNPLMKKLKADQKCLENRLDRLMKMIPLLYTNKGKQASNNNFDVPVSADEAIDQLIEELTKVSH